MLDIRKRLFIVVGLVVGIILAVLLFIIYGKDVNVTQILNKPQTEKPVVQTQENISTTTGKAAPLPEVVPPEAVNLNPRQLAKLFVERFGSYSNQNNNTHIADALLLSSPSMVKWLQTQSKIQDSNYQGVTTRVLTITTKENGDKATANIGVEQVISTKNGDETKQRTGRVDMVLLAGMWRVDGLYWDK